MLFLPVVNTKEFNFFFLKNFMEIRLNRHSLSLSLFEHMKIFNNPIQTQFRFTLSIDCNRARFSVRQKCVDMFILFKFSALEFEPFGSVISHFSLNCPYNIQLEEYAAVAQTFFKIRI